MYRYNGHGIVSRPVVFYRLTKRRNSRLAPRLLRQSFLFRTREWPRTLRVLSRTYDFSSDVPDAYRENLEELKQTDGGSAKNETVPPSERSDRELNIRFSVEIRTYKYVNVLTNTTIFFEKLSQIRIRICTFRDFTRSRHCVHAPDIATDKNNKY